MKLALLFVEEWCIMYIKLQNGYKIRFSNQKETKINFGLSVLNKGSQKQDNLKNKKSFKKVLSFLSPRPI